MSGETGQWLRLSLQSVINNTSYKPIVVYSGDDIASCASFVGSGVEVVPAASRLRPSIERLRNERNLPAHAEGAFLRYEIPTLLTDDFILYVDCDTFFLGDLPAVPLFEECLGAIPTSTNEGGDHHYNSGVLVFNRTKYISKQDDFFEFLERTLGSWLPSSVDEQAFNHFWRGQIATLPREYNWRPRWGFREDVHIVHFHGFKANVVAFIEGDLRSISRSVKKTYVYELAREYSSAVFSVYKYLEGIDGRGFLNGNGLKPIFDRMSAVLAQDYLIARQMASVANLVGAAEAALSLAKIVDQDETERLLATVKLTDRSGPIRQLRVHPCSRFGVGNIEVHAKQDLLKKLQVTPNSNIAIDQPSYDEKLTFSWAGVGLDCHFVIWGPEGLDLSEIECLVIRSAPITLCRVVAVYHAGGEEIISDD